MSKTLEEIALQVANAIPGPCAYDWYDDDIKEFALRLVTELGAQEPVAWRTHHDEPMLFPTFDEAAMYCEDDETPEPLYAAPVVPEGWQMVPKEAIMDAVRKYGSTMTNAEILAEYKP